MLRCSAPLRNLSKEFRYANTVAQARLRQGMKHTKHAVGRLPSDARLAQ